MILAPGTDLKYQPQICEVKDKNGEQIKVSELTSDANHVSLTTTSGAKVKLPLTQVTALDFRQTNAKSLSDMTPKVELAKGAFLGREAAYYRKNANLDGGEIRVKSGQDKDKNDRYRTFKRGVSLHAPVTLEYKLNDEFKTFEAYLGIDTQVTDTSKVKLTIVVDGEEHVFHVSSADALKKISIPVAGKTQLTIKVESDGDDNLYDLGNHVTLAEARLLK